MALEIVGKLQQVLPEQGGTNSRGSWSKQDFVIETVEQYPRKVCVSAWGDKAKGLEGVQLGESLKISVNIESREFNGRWYTDVRAWKIEKEGAASAQQPYAASAVVGAAAPSSDDSVYLSGASEEVDDLPF